MSVEVEETETDPRAAAAELLLYDYFKHLTSLSIITLGGVLLVAQELDGAAVQLRKVTAVLILISAGGVGAFHGSSEIVRARLANVPLPAQVRWLRILTPLLLSGGVGVFLSLFLDILD